jgi:surfactin synthase thioesterase subunit
MSPRSDAAAPFRMWCLPFAGGGAAVWHPWAGRLAGLAEIVALRLPGRESRLSEECFRQLSSVIPLLADLLTPFTKEDYVLCGHSLGGLVAFELCRAIRARSLPLPAALIVSGVRAPHHPPDRPLLHGLPARDFIAEVERRYGIIPPEIRNHPEFLELLLPVLRADLEMYETYRYAPAAPLDLPILALGGSRDHMVTESQVLDWRACTTGTFEAEMISGGHFFLQENLEATTERVRRFLLRRLNTPSSAD